MVKRPSDKAYGTLITVGMWLAIGGFFGGGVLLILSVFPFGKLISLAFMAVAGACIVCFFIGLIILAVVLAAGLRVGSGFSKKIVRHDNVKVIARYALNCNGEMLFDQIHMDPTDTHLKLYVRLQSNGYASHEYRCNGYVWGQCGESMVGTAMIQGDWVGQFVPTMGPGQGHPHYREVAQS